MDVRALSGADREAILAWRYPDRYSTYVGYGLAPDLVGRGMGSRFVEAILEFARERDAPERIRLYILDWNERSRKVAEGHGFTVESVLPSDEGDFLMMVREGVAVS